MSNQDEPTQNTQEETGEETATDEETPSVTVVEETPTTLLLNLEQMIKTNLSALEQLREDLKLQREMFANTLLNDEVYKGHEDRAKEATKVKMQTRQQILKQPSIATIAEKIKDIATEMRERKSSLSEYLLEFRRLSGLSQLETDNGEIIDIVLEAKTVKRSAPKKRG